MTFTTKFRGKFIGMQLQPAILGPLDSHAAEILEIRHRHQDIFARSIGHIHGYESGVFKGWKINAQMAHLIRLRGNAKARMRNLDPRISLAGVHHIKFNHCCGHRNGIDLKTAGKAKCAVQLARAPFRRGRRQLNGLQH